MPYAKEVKSVFPAVDSKPSSDIAYEFVPPSLNESQITFTTTAKPDSIYKPFTAFISDIKRGVAFLLRRIRCQIANWTLIVIRSSLWCWTARVLRQLFEHELSR